MTLALALLTTLVTPSLATATSDTEEMQLKIPYTEVILDNGLQVLLSESSCNSKPGDCNGYKRCA